MKKFAAVALAVAALTLSACTPATSTPVAAPSPSQAAPSPSQAPISVPATVQAPALPAPTVTTAPAPCEEDEPCWDCATMGNMICGPVEAPAQPVQAVQPLQPVQPVKSAPVVPAQPVQLAPAPVQSDQSTANTVPAHREDVPKGGAWMGMTLHYNTTAPAPAPKEGKVEGQSCTITGC